MYILLTNLLLCYIIFIDTKVNTSTGVWAGKEGGSEWIFNIINIQTNEILVLKYLTVLKNKSIKK